MKTEATTKRGDTSKDKTPSVVMNPLLEKERDKIFFPEKLAKANALLKTAKLPQIKRGE